MATTTTNFGWDIPQSTDLVKDGATAIAALGQDIDTAFVDLKGGTTGQVLAKASNTDLDYSWVAQDDSNAIQNTQLTAKGALISAFSAGTPATLTVGTNGQVLTADSTAATGIKWASASAGSLTLLSTTTLSGATTTISIGTGYQSLYITAEKTNTTGNDQYWFRFNGDSGSNYKYVGYEQNGTTDQLVGSGGYATFVRLGYTPSSSNTISQQVINIPNYLTDTWKLGNYTIANLDGSSPNRPTLETQSFSYNSATAISSITFGCMYNSFNAGTVKIYGVN
jgi:hypothetical protein